MSQIYWDTLISSRWNSWPISTPYILLYLLSLSLWCRLEEEFTRRIEKIQTDLRGMWEASHRGDLEEAVARARLDWLKRLPEVQREGGTARQSFWSKPCTKNPIGPLLYLVLLLCLPNIYYFFLAASHSLPGPNCFLTPVKKVLNDSFFLE